MKLAYKTSVLWIGNFGKCEDIPNLPQYSCHIKNQIDEIKVSYRSEDGPIYTETVNIWDNGYQYPVKIQNRLINELLDRLIKRDYALLSIKELEVKYRNARDNCEWSMADYVDQLIAKKQEEVA